MKKAVKTAMMTSISEVIETMFFLSLEFNDQTTFEESGILSGKPCACKIGFEGGFSGCFFLLVPEKLLNYMAQSFMGLDKDDLKDEHINGTIKETINMLAGSTLSGYDDKVEFQLAIPEIVDSGKATDSGKEAGEEDIVVITETTEGYLAFKTVIKS